MVADFTSNDGGKVGVLGGAWIHTATPTPPQGVVVVVEVPGEHLNEEFALELSLHGEHTPVLLPDPLTGDERPLRVAQNLVAVSIPGMPRKAPNRAHFVVNMAPGLPLLPDHVYTWRVQVDGESRPDWATSFYVRQEPAGPVVG
jgi:hypothetical protein